MIIHSAKYISSGLDITGFPKPVMPEYAFTGRSNVGKSSLINMLVNQKNLARISEKPGKTQSINHFLVNDQWYLADLPGYGYAKTSKEKSEKWTIAIEKYILERRNLLCLFHLIDSRIEPQGIDLDFMEWLGVNHIPFNMVFTKTDKVSSGEWKKNFDRYSKVMLEGWEEMPRHFVSSAFKKTGQKEILDFIEQTNTLFKIDYNNIQ